MTDENIIFCTLSVGKRYTEDYTCKLINDVLTNTKCRFAVTTDFPEIIKEKFPNENRILIDFFDRNQYKLRLPIGVNKGASDFNFNVRYTALKQCLGLPEKFVIFTDCDNSLPRWEEEGIGNNLQQMLDNGFDFSAPRSNYKLKDVLIDYHKQVSEGNPTPTIFWHKIWAFDLVNNPKPEWDNVSLPAEFILVLANVNGKLEKFYEGWKSMHDWMANLPYTEGTWAEGFEIGVAAHLAGYVTHDMGWGMSVINNCMVASGHKVGHPTSGLDNEN
jgi:hypothetical protein